MVYFWKVFCKSLPVADNSFCVGGDIGYSCNCERSAGGISGGVYSGDCISGCDFGC